MSGPQIVTCKCGNTFCFIEDVNQTCPECGELFVTLNDPWSSGFEIMLNDYERYKDHPWLKTYMEAHKIKAVKTDKGYVIIRGES